jgi:type VI secretion system protein ImpH
VAAQDRTNHDCLAGSLAGKGRNFSFFQLVRLLERQSQARVGTSGPADAEGLRFRPDSSLGFPANDVVAVEPVSTSPHRPSRLRITTSFLGLYGSTSPLPITYGEDVLSEDPDRSRVRDFLDIFHHRLISLLYRCWCKYRYLIEFEHRKDDPITPRLFAFLSLGSPSLMRTAGISDCWRLLHFAGMFQHQPHSAADLERILSDYFDGLPVEVEQCTGRWIPIREEQVTRLGRGNCHLGVDCSLGKRVFGRMTSFRIWLGPLEHDRMLDFLPDQDNYTLLRRIVEFFVKDPLEFDVGFRVQGLPRLQLTSEAACRTSTRLGWNTWLFSETPAHARKELVVL